MRIQSFTAVSTTLLALSSVMSSLITAEKSLLPPQSQIVSQKISGNVYLLNKRAEDHSDHVHNDHKYHPVPVPSTTTPLTGPSPTPSHDDHLDHTHDDHDHSHESKVEGDDHAGHSHSESEAGHSHGPARYDDIFLISTLLNKKGCILIYSFSSPPPPSVLAIPTTTHMESTSSGITSSPSWFCWSSQVLVVLFP